MSSALAFLVVSVAVIACGASDGEEEMGEASSAHHKQYECPKGGRYDVKPLGDHEKKTLSDHRDGGKWRFDSGGMAKTKDGRTVMGAPGDDGKWIFCVEDGDAKTYRIVDDKELRAKDVDVALSPLHNKGYCRRDACEYARKAAKRCADKRKSYDPDGGLTSGFAWMEAESDVDEACKGCSGY